MKFGIRSLLIVTFLVACVMALFSYDAPWIFLTLIVVLAVNLLGAIAATTLTKASRFPTDLSDPETPAE